MRICAVIVTYNIGPEILSCYQAIQDQVHEVVIVDNASGISTVGLLAEIGKNAGTTVIFNQQNRGIAAALNQGVRCAIGRGCDWVLTLDHDSTATAGMIAAMLAAYATLAPDEKKRVGILAARPFDVNAQTFLGFDPAPAPRTVVSAISSGSLINGQVFSSIDYFNENLFIYYVDDDFCLRLNKAGWKIYVCPDAVLRHQEGKKQWKHFMGKRVCYNNYSEKAVYYIARNTIHMLKNYYSYSFRYTYTVIRRLAVDLIKIVCFDRWRWRKTTFFFKGLFHGLAGI